MTEKQLIQQLTELRSSVDHNWVKKNRELLSYQIFNGAEYSDTALGFFDRLSLISKRVLQPTPIAALIALFFVASGFVGVRASRNATPGEPWYIAKTISEKAQLATTFNETGKAKLNLEFAKERANELSKVTSTENKDDTSQVAELSAGFKQQIESARERIVKIEATKKVTAPVAKKDVKKDSEEAVMSAEAGKDTTGIEVSLPAQKALEEAEKLFNDKNYNGAANKLDEIGKQLQ